MDNQKDIEDLSTELIDKEGESEDDEVDPIGGSPLYPSIFTGDSAKPLMGQYPESEYKDDNNIHNTWLGLISYYG